MIKTVIFDIDGTLYDFDKANGKALDAIGGYAEEHLGIPAAEFNAEFREEMDIYTDLVGEIASIHNRVIRAERYLEKKGLPLTPHVLRIAELYWKTLLGSMEIEEGIRPFMEALKSRGYRIGIGSNMTAYVQFIKLERLGLLDLIDFVVTSEEAGYEKPSEGFFRFCLSKAGCRAEECLFIGDSLHHDVEGAERAGMHGIRYGEEGIRYPECLQGENLVVGAFTL